MTSPSETPAPMPLAPKKTAAPKVCCFERKADAIAVAQELFWRDGYDGASIDDVIRATGLNRYALYQMFGGKRGLFLAALDAYFQEGKAATLALLGDPTLRAFDAIKLSMVQKLVDPDLNGCGCMMITTAVELAPKDPEIADQMAQYMGELKGVMQAAISRAKAEGDIAPETDAAGVSELIFSLFTSSGVLDRMGIPQAQVVAHLENAIEALRVQKRS